MHDARTELEVIYNTTYVTNIHFVQ